MPKGELIAYAALSSSTPKPVRMPVTDCVTLMVRMSILQSLHRQLKSQSRGEQFRAHQGQQQANHLRINATIVNLLTGDRKYAALRWISTGFPSRDRANELSSCDLQNVGYLRVENNRVL